MRSVDAGSLERTRLVLEAQRAERAAAAAERAREARRTDPPDDGQVWLSVPEAAAVMGVSRNRVGQWARSGQLPATQCGWRWWVRRVDVEVVANARRFRAGWGRDQVDLGLGRSVSGRGAAPG